MHWPLQRTPAIAATAPRCDVLLLAQPHAVCGERRAPPRHAQAPCVYKRSPKHPTASSKVEGPALRASVWIADRARPSSQPHGPAQCTARHPMHPPPSPHLRSAPLWSLPWPAVCPSQLCSSAVGPHQARRLAGRPTPIPPPSHPRQASGIIVPVSFQRRGGYSTRFA